MNLPLILLGGGLAAIGLLIKSQKKELTETPENEINPDTASKKRANTETDEIIDNNKDNSNIDGGGLADVDNLGESEKSE